MVVCSLLQVVSDRVDKPRNIEFKGATDLVTDTDKASEDAVLSVSVPRQHLFPKLQKTLTDGSTNGSPACASGRAGSYYQKVAGL